MYAAINLFEKYTPHSDNHTNLFLGVIYWPPFSDRPILPNPIQTGSYKPRDVPQFHRSHIEAEGTEALVPKKARSLAILIYTKVRDICWRSGRDVKKPRKSFFFNCSRTNEKASHNARLLYFVIITDNRRLFAPKSKSALSLCKAAYVIVDRQ